MPLTPLHVEAVKRFKVGTRCCASETVKLNTDAERRVPTRLSCNVKSNSLELPTGEGSRSLLRNLIRSFPRRNFTTTVVRCGGSAAVPLSSPHFSNTEQTT